MFRRMAEVDLQSGWLRVEEYADEGTLVVRAEMPDIDTDNDVEPSVSNDVLHIRAQREEATEKKDNDATRSFLTYARANLAANGITAVPALYRLADGPGAG